MMLHALIRTQCSSQLRLKWYSIVNLQVAARSWVLIRTIQAQLPSAIHSAWQRPACPVLWAGWHGGMAC